MAPKTPDRSCMEDSAAALAEFGRRQGLDPATDETLQIIQAAMVAQELAILMTRTGSWAERLRTGILRELESGRTLLSRLKPMIQAAVRNPRVQANGAALENFLEEALRTFEAVATAREALERAVRLRDLVASQGAAQVHVPGEGAEANVLERSLAVLLVRVWEEDLRRNVTAPDAALLAIAFGIARPEHSKSISGRDTRTHEERAWQIFTERWKRRLKEARAVRRDADVPETWVLRNLRGVH